MRNKITCPCCGSGDDLLIDLSAYCGCRNCCTSWDESRRQPCHEPLPLDCTNEEWVKAAFALFPMLETICLSKNESLIGLGDNRGTCIFSIYRPEGWENKSYFRKDYFPPPKPDWASMVGMFGKFWNDEPSYGIWDYLKAYNPGEAAPFASRGSFVSWKHFKPGLPPERIAGE